MLQDLGYEFDNDEFHAHVHGNFPYEALKPDPLLRNLLLSMPQRKIVCQRLYKKFSTNICFREHEFDINSCGKYCVLGSGGLNQIFTNADKAHAAQVLSRLGLEGCFEAVICF